MRLKKKYKFILLGLLTIIMVATTVCYMQNKNKNDNRANNDVPYTGIEDTIPVIFILAVIALLAYINYRRYKNI